MTAPVPLPHAGAQRIGQGTAIEQSRAAAEVYASVLSAQARPRDVQYAIRAMKEACGMRELAERAFFRFSRGGSQVSGESVYLARELARCWGNIHWGVSELRRDDAALQSEMQAFAWDLETNARNAAIFIVPHKRDKRGGPEALTDMRDIYENNANAGARRVREAIFSVLPTWYREQAKELCIKTLQDGGGKPLPQRIAAAIELFAGLGVSEQQLAEKVGRPSKVWTPLDLAPLTVIYQSIQRGETTRDEEFPPETAVVTAAELATPTGPPAADATKRKTRTTKTTAPARGGAGAAPAAAAPTLPPPGSPLPGPETPQDEEALRRQEQLEMEAEIAEHAAADTARDES